VEEPDGIIQSLNQHVTPRSLYYKQLQERMGTNALNSQLLPAQKVGSIYSYLESWSGEGLFMDPVVTWYDEDSDPLTPFEFVDIGGYIRDLNLMDNSPTFLWRLIDGPGGAVFEGSTESLKTAVSFEAPGDYVLELVVSDVNGSTSATLSMSVSGVSK
jgi:hypothetical protein